MLECLKWHNFSVSHDEAASTESKTEVPRFDGEASRLAEYQFRVRLKQARERNITDTKKKEWGPLAIRLIDGLRGPALQVARNLKIDKLEDPNEGVQYLLSSLQAALQPRSKQEACELYQVGAQQGGVLSRQQGEPIPSYVLRRKAWYSMMLDLDEDLRLPEGILAEQLLQNAGISSDHMLLIRTAIQSDMTWDKVCEELVAQHSRIHERETKGGKSFGKGDRNMAFKGGGKHFGKRKGGWRAYHVEEDEEYHAEENWENASQSLGGYEDYDQTSYWSSDGSPQYHEMEDDDTMYSAFQVMVDEGLDETSQEAIDYAAEVLQAESEVYWARQKAFGTGHKGFWSNTRDFKVQGGSLTLEEKKARIQSLKSRTQCRKCGQYGHWGDDPSCPRNSKKGGKKGGGSPGSATSTSGGKSSGAKSGGKSKSPEKSRNVYFTINEYEKDQGGVDARSYVAVKTYHAVPPPECLQGGAATSGSGSLPSQNPGEERSADEVMDELIAEAQRRTEKRKKTMLTEETAFDLGHEQMRTKEEVEKRQDHLDRFLAVVNNPDDPEWRDAYNERWNEFVPGHPLFCESDQRQLQLWTEKAKRGLPKIPGDEEAKEKKEDAKKQEVCSHENVTRHGSNGYWKILKCKDCGKVLEKLKVEKAEPMKVGEESCQHLEKDYRGTTGTTWRWKCKACGKIESGTKRSGESGHQASQLDRGGDRVEAEAVSRIIDMMRYTVEMQQELGFHVSLAQLDKIYNKCRDLVIGGSSLAKTSTLTTTTADTKKGPQAPPSRGLTKEELVEFRGRVLGSGVHKGKTFQAIYDKEKTYLRRSHRSTRAEVSKTHSCVSWLATSFEKMVVSLWL